MKNEFVVMHKRFSVVFNEELKLHGIKSGEFMMSCPIKHDNYIRVKKVAI